MASPEEIKKQQIAESNSLLGEQISLTAELSDQVNFIVKTMKEKGILDKGSIDLTREAVKLTRNLGENYQKSSDVAKDITKNERLINQIKKQQAALDSQANGALKTELSLNNDILSKEAQQYQALEQTASALEKNAEYLAEQATQQDNITDGMGFLGRSAEGLSGTLSSMGAGEFGKKLGLESAAKKAKEMSIELTDGGKKSLGAFGKVRVAIGTMGAALKSALGPLALLAMVKKAYSDGEVSANRLNGENVQIARTLGIAQENANKLAGEARSIGGAMGITGAAASASMSSIYTALDGTEKLSKSTLETFMKLNVFAGMSAENIADIQKLSKLTGEDAGQLADSMAQTAKETIKANKLNVSMKTLMSDAAKASNVVKLSIKGGGAELIKTVAQSKKLGLELKAVEDIAGGLLDIEESLAAEMEAELLTGRELNLEKAREAALNNDLSTVMSEITKQGIDQEAFTKMNRTQQDAVAKAVGMTRDSMGDMLAKQKENVAVNADLVAGTKEGTAAMESTASAAETLAAHGEMMGNMMAPLHAAMRPLVMMFEEMGTKIMKDLVSPLVEKLMPPIMKLANAIMPVLLEIFSGIGDLIGAALDALMPFIDVIVELVEQLMPVVLNLWNSIKGAIMSIITALSPILTMIAEMASKLLPIIMDIFANFLVPLVEKLMGFFVEIVAKLLPIFEKILIAVMPILTTLLDAFMQIADAVLPAILELFDLLLPVIMDILDAFMPIIDDILDLIISMVPVIVDLIKMLVPIIKDIIKAFMPIIGDILNAVMLILPDVISFIKMLLPPIIELVKMLLPLMVPILELVLSVLSPILDLFISLATSIMPALIGLFKLIEPLLKPILSIIGGVFDMIIGIINGDWDKVGNGLKKVGEGILNLLIGLLEGLLNLIISGVNAILDGIMPGDQSDLISKVEFGEVKLATGGIVTSPTRALIGEAGPEAVVPLNNDKSMNVYSKALEEKLDTLIAVIQQGGNVYLDGNKVGTVLGASTYKMQ